MPAQKKQSARNDRTARMPDDRILNEVSVSEHFVGAAIGTIDHIKIWINHEYKLI